MSIGSLKRDLQQITPAGGNILEKLATFLKDITQIRIKLLKNREIVWLNAYLKRFGLKIKKLWQSRYKY